MQLGCEEGVGNHAAGGGAPEVRPVGDEGRTKMAIGEGSQGIPENPTSAQKKRVGGGEKGAVGQQEGGEL